MEEQGRDHPKSQMVEKDARRNAKMMKVNWILIAVSLALAILSLVTGKQDHVMIFLFSLSLTFGHSYTLFVFTAMVGEARDKGMDDMQYIELHRQAYNAHYGRR